MLFDSKGNSDWNIVLATLLPASVQTIVIIGISIYNYATRPVIQPDLLINFSMFNSTVEPEPTTESASFRMT